MQEKGTIALDVDGTITTSDRLIPDEVVSYLESLHNDGWQIALVTGRSFSFAMGALSKINFPYLLAVQNGADLLEMPEKKVISRSYIDHAIVQFLDQLYVDQKEDFIIYSGYERGDFCYYRPHRFSPPMLKYLEELKLLCSVPWQEVETFELKEQSHFPLIKCIGSKELMESFDEKLRAHKGVKTSVIRDPIDRSLYLILVTHDRADKGMALRTLMKKFSLPRPLITGGDDNNDIPLLREGDIKIAMDGAPDVLQELADIIAPPSEQKGIIRGLDQALDRLR